MQNNAPKEIYSLPKLKLAVIGHIEWVTFLKVDQLPLAGQISHAKDYYEEAAGGAAVAAVQMARLINGPVDLITALGKDNYGKKCYERLTKLGLNLKVAWREKPTRKGISLISKDGERAITVIGERLQPIASDDLPWSHMKNYDGIFVTATDEEGIRFARKANFLAATPRTGENTLRNSKVKINALIGSGLDPGEKINYEEFAPKPEIYISTEGKSGGTIYPDKHKYNSIQPSSKEIDTYGCGDCFAGAVTTALSAKLNLDQAIKIGAYCGAECSTHYGPY
ncbi:PfkB family carbohydrate kinase [Prochlorococcus marinus]|uniref:Ribokinase n=1 Tax=Prochlorococcus marinus XMU1408 TaxID=2213228 RepID=A0A318R2E0_PROMR|nr:PfkB family carbohydrate kinase [Prochlorococcus marinus]MBW3042316.1 ribokinase [Prochlorococcus marinus str. XMU1408]PYE01702.1 ribokinase [Prochlorococcus marinus XMU1408]